MPHPEKNKVGGQLNDVVAAVDDDFLASFGALSVDELANVLEFLPPNDIMRQRRVCRKCSEAVKMAIVPLTDSVGFCVRNVKNYSAMTVITTAMPNLQQITLCALEWRHKFSEGEDPDEERAAITADNVTHDIGIITTFRKLRILNISHAPLNGRYSVLFNFPLLQKLSITGCKYLKCDLKMLAGLPSLKELHCESNRCLTDNINSLRVLKDTLERVTIAECYNVEGNFMDLADFPSLKELNLVTTSVTGDIRDIGDNDFSSLETLRLPRTVYGGWGYEVQSISEATDLMRKLYLLKKQRSRTSMSLLKDWCGKLSENSPDWYESMNENDSPPFYIRFVEAGSRLGYRWETIGGLNPCEVNWLDPEPERESIEYEEYMREIERDLDLYKVYKGFRQPPTEEEYNGLHEEW